jgi:AraC-like DNA-binding protein
MYISDISRMKRAHTIHFLHHGSEQSEIGFITTVARLEDSDGTPGTKRRTLGSYGLVYVQSGQGSYEDDRQILEVNAGDLILLRPQVVHRYKPEAKTPWNEYFMLFEGSLFELWEQQGLFPEDRPLLKLDPIDLWLDRFKAIYASGTSALQQITRLQNFLADALAHDCYQVSAKNSQSWIDRAQHHLSQHLNESEGVLRSAKAMGQSYDAFRKKYTRLTGIAPKQFMMNRVMGLAAQRLIETSRSTHDIADELGFCDQFHFSKRFKQHTGITPSKYRMRLKVATNRSQEPTSDTTKA